MDSQLRYKEKSVIIHRDEKGFGFRVGGENPVFVQYVHADQAAWKAGVRKDDRIIKVNGTLVRSYNHQRVVHMIQNCTPFVNLTLHSPETSDHPNVVLSRSQSPDPNIDLYPSQRLHPHSMSNNLNWLLDIGDDLFQDNQQRPSAQQQQQPQQQSQLQQPQINFDPIPIAPNTHLHQPVGISKLIVSGPSTLTSSQSQLNMSSSVGGKPKLRHNKSQSSARDNPYYYYKTVPEKGPDSANSSILGQDNHQGTSKTATGLSISRSRSSSKMSTRSMSGKYKTKNLRSRLVEDLKLLTITNSQTTPSSLSTSPSSSDLSDCDDQDSSRLDNISMNTSSSSANTGLTANADSSGIIPVPQAKAKHTTRRLEIIRELIDTEKTHTERLKHLNDLIYKPIKAEGLVPIEQLKMVFSCHKTLFKIHRQIYKILSAAQRITHECHQEPLVGRALVEIFEGDLGIRLEKAASTFCACQATNTELLNRFTRKDTKAGEFLAQVANQQMLGRLGIKDLLASCFQRLTKYPLLLDNLLKATPAPGISGGIHSKSLSEGSIAFNSNTVVNNCPTTDGLVNDGFINNESSSVTSADMDSATPSMLDDSPLANNDKQTAIISNKEESSYNVTNTLEDDYAFERLCISRALDQSRQILIHVNEAVKRAISHNKLRDIWKKTDKNPTLDVIDIETQQLLHDGPLTMRTARRSFEVYVLLLTHYLVILTREGQDKYKLKPFTAEKETYSPIFNIDEHLATRDTATDENGFYLLCKRKVDSRIFEFAAQSPADRAKWKEKIHLAQSYNFAAVPDDDNTLTRYRELITLTTSSNTPNNIEHSPTNNNVVPTIIGQSVNTSLNDNFNTSVQHINNSNIDHDLNDRAQDV